MSNWNGQESKDYLEMKSQKFNIYYIWNTLNYSRFEKMHTEHWKLSSIYT